MLQEKKAFPGSDIDLNSQRDILPKPQAVRFHLIFTHHSHHLFSKSYVWNKLPNSTFGLTNNWDGWQKHLTPPHLQKNPEG